MIWAARREIMSVHSAEKPSSKAKSGIGKIQIRIAPEYHREVESGLHECHSMAFVPVQGLTSFDE
jgi:hypothetical protein